MLDQSVVACQPIVHAVDGRLRRLAGIEVGAVTAEPLLHTGECVDHAVVQICQYAGQRGNGVHKRLADGVLDVLENGAERIQCGCECVDHGVADVSQDWPQRIPRFLQLARDGRGDVLENGAERIPCLLEFARDGRGDVSQNRSQSAPHALPELDLSVEPVLGELQQAIECALPVTVDELEHHADDAVDELHAFLELLAEEHEQIIGSLHDRVAVIIPELLHASECDADDLADRLHRVVDGDLQLLHGARGDHLRHRKTRGQLLPELLHSDEGREERAHEQARQHDDLRNRCRDGDKRRDQRHADHSTQRHQDWDQVVLHDFDERLQRLHDRRALADEVLEPGNQRDHLVKQLSEWILRSHHRVDDAEDQIAQRQQRQRELVEDQRGHLTERGDGAGLSGRNGAQLLDTIAGHRHGGQSRSSEVLKLCAEELHADDVLPDFVVHSAQWPDDLLEHVSHRHCATFHAGAHGVDLILTESELPKN